MEIIRQVFVFLLLLFTTATVSGKSCNETLPLRTVLFKVTKSNSSKTSYLFGTHHAFGKPFFDSLTNANQVLAACDVLIKENLNIPGHMAQDIINRRIEKTKWTRLLDQEDMAFIENLFASSPTDFQKMSPTELYVFLNRYFKEQACLGKDSASTYLSLDDYIGSKAKELDMELLGLETSEDQIELINKDVEGMPRKVHKRRLSMIIEQIRSNNSQNCAETDWYDQMDIEYQLDQPCRNTLMLRDRNDKWMKTIQKSLETNNCFIAVGLSHLMYECGLIKQLQKLGYNVSPIPVR
ncbi:TraB/GumN family protein [Echinicola sp. CAU 1574]|uniref:TraB/GumN family protein n=1 Tax=Echinicola arenosa TaxID=2774144 RepID=A0ABR9AME9_9BACT|nr:TraB/GumN family protein [Echinicola arenosa]MBD8489972.1 TraB/GumN family protein [Echinicola arenosa]